MTLCVCLCASIDSSCSHILFNVWSLLLLEISHILSPLLLIVLMLMSCLFYLTFGLLYRFLLPATLIVINDIAAYIFGFFFGKTPLIKLSPKKTWEGFIGASVTTIISAFMVSTISICYWWYKTIGIFLAGGLSLVTEHDSLSNALYSSNYIIIKWLQQPK